MTQRLRRTLRSFLQTERPATPEDAREVLDEWFGRYRPDPDLLDQEVERHFAGAPPSTSLRGEAPRVLESLPETDRLTAANPVQISPYWRPSGVAIGGYVVRDLGVMED